MSDERGVHYNRCSACYGIGHVKKSVLYRDFDNNIIKLQSETIVSCPVCKGKGYTESE